MDRSGLYISADAQPRRAKRKIPIELMGVLVLICLILVAVCVLIFSSRASLDSTGLALVAGIFVITVILAVGVLSLSRRNDEEASNGYIDAVFAEHSTPFVITEDEHPFAANKSYLRLFGTAAYNDALQSEIVPPIDALINITTEEEKQALYRLHNLRADAAAELADFYRQDETGGLIAFQLRVSGLGHAKLWEVIDIPVLKNESPLFDSAPIGMMSVTPEGEVLSMNQALKAWVGDDFGDDIKLSNIIENSDMFTASEPAPGRKIRSEAKLITTSGVHVPVVLNANWVKFASGQLIAITAIHGHSNIHTETSQLAPQDPLAVMGNGGSLMNSPMAALEVDTVELTTAKLVRDNRAFQDMFGAVASIGDDVSKLLHLTGTEDVTQAFDSRLKNAAETPVTVYIAPNHELRGGAFIYIIDISARRSLETQLSQSQKMQAIGQLAAGVAHDFNNLLQALRLNSDDLLGRHPIGDPSYADLQSINSTINRAAALVKKLLAFSRQQTLRPEVLDLGEALSDIMIVLRQVMVERVKLDIIFGRGVPDIMADKSQLETVLMNLCVNARDAMMDQGGGMITIETRALNRSDITQMPLAQELAALASDNLAVISVSDTGSGIEPQVLDKIFEPFFTTKEQGKGTGLGLATVYGIVQQSGGHLTVESELGVGTSFHLYFPQVDAETARQAAEAAAQIPKLSETRAPADLAGQGHILFVEDEDDVRLMAARTLRKRGYNVIEAADGEEALEILEEGETQFDLMISDVVMPGMDGPTLLKQGKAYIGEARIIFISGYAKEDFSELLAEYPDVSFLPKPFGLKELAEKVKEQIGESIV